MYNYAWISVAVNNELGLRGNGAAVVFTSSLKDTDALQRAANDMNQPATCFLKQRRDNEYDIRWFAPDAEIELCGHGALAAAGALFELRGVSEGRFYFSESKIIRFKADERFVQIDTDAIPVVEKAEVSEPLVKGIGEEIVAYYKTTNKHIILLKDAEAVKNMKPDFAALRRSKEFGYIVTAPGVGDADVVSRTLVPHVQQLEDHATGSSHAVLTPFWSEKLNKNELVCRQLSERGGEFVTRMVDERVVLKTRYRQEIKGEYAVFA